ncbi:MAG: GTP 3',8-cyclase MoaA [Gemmiger sp.]
MLDQFDRPIRYMRLSITDRCNLRCRYCMPRDVPPAHPEDTLTYDELYRVAAAAVGLGITRFKITGGEPLVRSGCVEFMARLKALPGVEQVTLTTNGLLLAPLAARLAGIGLDGVNISLDAADRPAYAAITGADALDTVLHAIDACLAAGLKTKVNSVLLPGCEARLVPLACLAAARPLDVRFIELMPIGAGARIPGPRREQALAILRARWPDLRPVAEQRGNGPARYYASQALAGRIGMIDALSRRFCQSCNRVRLTSRGLLKPCLCYGEGVDLRAVLRTDPAALPAALRRAVWQKPRAHCFEDAAAITEQQSMNAIGG